MTSVNGMTVKQFKDTIEEMRNLIDFTDDEAKIVNLSDLRSMSNKQIDIVFKRDDITVALSKGVEIWE